VELNWTDHKEQAKVAYQKI